MAFNCLILKTRCSIQRSWRYFVQKLQLLSVAMATKTP